MAMNPDILGPALQAAVKNTPLDASGTAYFKAMAAAIIEHIQTHGVVTVNSLTAAAAGVTAGPGTAVVTGTGAGTIT